MGLSLPDPEWVSIPANIVDALDIKGYRRRAYYCCKFFYTYTGWNETSSYDRFVLIVYQNENDLMCEIRCMGSSYSSEPDTTTIDPVIIRKFYDGLRKKWSGDFRNMRIEEIEGRMFIHGLLSNTPHRSHYGKDEINDMFAGMMVESYGEQLSVAIRWNEKLPTFSDICDVSKRLNSLWHDGREINNKLFVNRKKDLTESVSFIRGEIDGLKEKLEKICELSANAMNTLSDKYGIEISI